MTSARPLAETINYVESAPHTILHGPRLLAARLICLSIVFLSLALFLLAIPVHGRELAVISRQATQSLNEAMPGQPPALLRLILSPDVYPVLVLVIEMTAILVLCISAAVIVLGKSDDWMALFVSLAHVTYGTYTAHPLDTLAAARPSLSPLVNMLQAVGLGCALLFFYLLPDGRFTPRWTRPLAGAWIVFTLAWGIFPNVPFNLSDPFTLHPVWFLALMVWWSTGLLAQYRRYRGTMEVARRQQTRLVVIALTLGVLGYAAVYLPRLILSPSTSEMVYLLYNLFSVPIFMMLIIPIPLAIAISIMRYQLFGIDVVIRRTLVYGILTAILASIYFCSVALLQWMLRPLLGGGSDLAVVASTLVIASLAQPLRRRIQAAIDRRFYRRKYDAARTLETFGVRLRDEVELEVLGGDLLAVVQETMQPEYASLWLKTPDSDGRSNA